MSDTEFLIGRSGLDLQDDFYPDDLPYEWRFDYYSSSFKALALPIDTEEDFEQIFEDLEADDSDVGDFELIITILEEHLEDVNHFEKLIKPFSGHESQIIFQLLVDSQPSSKIMSLLDNFRVSIQSKNKLKTSLKEVNILENYLYFDEVPVFYSDMAWDEKRMREYLEQISVTSQKTVLICKFAESETLYKIRIVADILGF